MTRLTLSVAADHPAFAGHFPSRPIVPGVVLLDESLRAIAAYRDATRDRAATETVRIGAAKFLSIVGPGEALRLELEPGARDESFSIRLVAGPPDAERTAVTATVSYEVIVAGLR